MAKLDNYPDNAPVFVDWWKQWTTPGKEIRRELRVFAEPVHYVFSMWPHDPAFDRVTAALSLMEPEFAKHGDSVRGFVMTWAELRALMEG